MKFSQTLSLSRPHNMFVYGTLKRGFYNHNTYLRHAESNGSAVFLDNGKTIDKYSLKLLGERNIPAFLELEEWMPQETGSRIEGEIFEISGDVLQAMDILEGVATGHYFRARRLVQMSGSEETLDCWVYLQECQQQKQEQEPARRAHFKSYSRYTPDLHALYIPPTSEADPRILELLQVDKTNCNE